MTTSNPRGRTCFSLMYMKNKVADPGSCAVWRGLWPLVAGIAGSNPAVGMDVCLL